ncbi:hypothetical protein [Sphingomonas sp.]|uniref:hypothetical protein n=1 Tax=Sphingomonas sp. TaxID=28214 RepID=UPI0025F529EF|nr:hypothetical protein [Sphingomonas sp.]
MALVGLMTVCNSAGIALGPAALQEIAPGEMRGQALAAYQLVATVVSAGLGPPMVALLAKATALPIGTPYQLSSRARWRWERSGFSRAVDALAARLRAASPVCLPRAVVHSLHQ